jgi:hypothetical protein
LNAYCTVSVEGPTLNESAFNEQISVCISNIPASVQASCETVFSLFRIIAIILTRLARVVNPTSCLSHLYALFISIRVKSEKFFLLTLL